KKKSGLPNNIAIRKEANPSQNELQLTINTHSVEKSYAPATLPQYLSNLLKRISMWMMRKINPRRRVRNIAHGLSKESISESLFESTQELFQSTRSKLIGLFKRWRKYQRPVYRQSRRRHIISTRSTGRNVRIVSYEAGRNILAPFATLLKSVFDGHYSIKTSKFHIADHDMKGWERCEKECLTLIFAVDISRSTYPFKSILAEILKSLRDYFNKNSDRIGLISIKGNQAKVLNHPTRNHRTIVKNLADMKIEGKTPLSDGLRKSLDMAILEKSRNPGSRSIVILFSDCYPEPLTHEYDDVMDEPSYKAAVKTASLFRDRKVKLVIVNPGYNPQKTTDFTPGERLAQKMTQVSDGKLIGLRTITHSFQQKEYLQHSTRDLRTIVSCIEEVFTGSGIFSGQSRGTRLST
ncbi:VWA domain-containing protein, partial [bacterium]|nr:VWA domain-containing protein [candidate division CSSED10-310 bacterium]